MLPGHQKPHGRQTSCCLPETMKWRDARAIPPSRPSFSKPLIGPTNQRPFHVARMNVRVSRGKGLEAQGSADACRARCRAGCVRASRSRVCGRSRMHWRAGQRTRGTGQREPTRCSVATDAEASPIFGRGRLQTELSLRTELGSACAPRLAYSNAVRKCKENFF